MSYYGDESEALEPSPTIDQPSGAFEATEAIQIDEDDLGDGLAKRRRLSWQ
jgi:hypothetical protein